MKKSFCRFLLALSAAFVPWAQGQGVDLGGDERDMVRVMRHSGGAQTIYQRQSGWKGMRCSFYGANGRLVAVNDYIEGKYGQLVACNVYDHTKKNIIYRVSYGYDSQARLIEERMYSEPARKLVQRVIYKYDAQGNRSKPIIISLDQNAAGRRYTPTMSDDVKKMHEQLRRNKR